MEFATEAGSVATPFTVITVVVPAGVKLAPVCGAVNVTATGTGNGVPSGPFTIATRLFANIVSICWDCGVPAMAEMDGGLVLTYIGDVAAVVV